MFHVNAFGFPPTEPSSTTRLVLVLELVYYVLLGKHHHMSPLTSVLSQNCKVCYFTSRAYYGNLNFFGGPSTTSVKASAKLKHLEEENEDAMFVVLSDVWLDSVEVMEKIHTMFSGTRFDCMILYKILSYLPTHFSKKVKLTTPTCTEV